MSLRSSPLVGALSSVLVSVTASATLLSRSLSARDETITAVGSVFCDNGAGNLTTFPLTGLRVELMDSDCDGSQICDDEMGTAYVQADGKYQVSGTGGDPHGGKPDVYVRFAYNDDHGVRLTDELDHTRSFSTPEHDHNNAGTGTIDLGGWVTGIGVATGDGTHCRVWSRAHQAFQSYVAEIGAEPPAGHLDVEYWSAVWSGTPWTNTDTIHWPIHYAPSVMSHEFGHSIRHAADGSASHFASDVTTYRYARTHDRCAPDANAQPGEALASVSGYGFNEGWAWYWANNVGGCPNTVSPDIEGEIARALHGVQVNTNSTRKDMLQVLLSNPGKIHSMDEYMNAFANRVGKSAAALIADAQRLSRTAVASTMPKPYSETIRASQIRAQIASIDMMIRSLRAPVPAPELPSGRGGGSGTVPCQSDDCEAIFNAVVGPIFRAGQVSALEAYRAELSKAAAPAWAEQVRRAQAAGTLDSWIRDYRSVLDRNVRAATENALTRATESLMSARTRLGELYELYARELLEARARLDSAANGRRGALNQELEPFRAQLVLPEETGQKR